MTAEVDTLTATAGGAAASAGVTSVVGAFKTAASRCLFGRNPVRATDANITIGMLVARDVYSSVLASCNVSIRASGAKVTLNPNEGQTNA